MFYVSLFFSFVNEYGKMTINTLQIMHCMLYYYTFKKIAFGLKENSRLCLTKHVHANHLENFMKIWKRSLEKQPIRKSAYISRSTIYYYFCLQFEPFQKDDVEEEKFLKNLTFFKVCG